MYPFFYHAWNTLQEIRLHFC